MPAPSRRDLFLMIPLLALGAAGVFVELREMISNTWIRLGVFAASTAMIGVAALTPLKQKILGAVMGVVFGYLVLRYVIRG